MGGIKKLIKFDLVWSNNSFENMFEVNTDRWPNCFSYQIFKDFDSSSASNKDIINKEIKESSSKLK